MLRKRLCIFIGLVLTLALLPLFNAASAPQEYAVSSYGTIPELVFHSGFDNGVVVSNTTMSGADISLPAGNNNINSWSAPGPMRDDFFRTVSNVFRNSGDSGRELYSNNPNAFYGIDVVPNPRNPQGNNVMRFAANAQTRLESGLMNPVGNVRLEQAVWTRGSNVAFDPRQDTQELYVKFDMLLGEDFQLLMDGFAGSIGWMMIAEFWNDINWVNTAGHSDYPFRVSINLDKPAGLGQQFYMRVDGQFGGNPPSNATTAGMNFGWNSLWRDMSTIPMPLGEWITVEMFYKAGGVRPGDTPGTAQFHNQGRGVGEFFMAVTFENGERYVISDRMGLGRGERPSEDNRVVTQNPFRPEGVTTGIQQFNPFKLYAATPAVQFINQLNERNIADGNPTNYMLEILYDNVEYWTTKPISVATSDLPNIIGLAGNAIEFAGTLDQVNVHMNLTTRLLHGSGNNVHTLPGIITVSPTGDGLTAAGFAAYFSTESLTAVPSGIYQIQILSSNKVVYNRTVEIINESAILPEPTVITHPASQTVVEGERGVFYVTVSNPPIRAAQIFQWQRSTDNGTSWVNIPGATGASYTTPLLAMANDGFQYRVVVANTRDGLVSLITSDAATVTIVGMETFTIAATHGANGFISPAGDVHVMRGRDFTFEFWGAGGYVIDELTVDGTPVTLAPGQRTFTFTDVTGNHTIDATFRQQIIVAPDITGPGAGSHANDFIYIDATGMITLESPHPAAGGYIEFAFDPQSNVAVSFMMNFTENPGTSTAPTPRWGVRTHFLDSNRDEIFSFRPMAWAHPIRWIHVWDGLSNISNFAWTPGPDLWVQDANPPGYRSNVVDHTTPEFEVTVVFKFENNIYRVYLNGQSAGGSGVGNLFSGNDLAYVRFYTGTDHSTWTIRDFRVLPEGYVGVPELNFPPDGSYGTAGGIVISDDGNRIDIHSNAVPTATDNFIIIPVDPAASGQVSVSFDLTFDEISVAPATPGNRRPFYMRFRDSNDQEFFNIFPRAWAQDHRWIHVNNNIGGDQAVAGIVNAFHAGETRNIEILIDFDQNTFAIFFNGSPTTVPGNRNIFLPGNLNAADIGSILIDLGTADDSKWIIENLMVEAIIEVADIPTHTITPTAGSNGIITPGSPQTVRDNGSIQFTFVPNPGYSVDEVLVNGVQVASGVLAHTIGNVRTDQTIHVIFMPLGAGPGTPRNLTATPGNGQVQLAWAAPTSEGGSPITGYEISVNGGSWFAATSPHTQTGLTNEATYNFRVRAVNDLGYGVYASASAMPTAFIIIGGLENGTHSGGNIIVNDGVISVHSPAAGTGSHILSISPQQTGIVSVAYTMEFTQPSARTGSPNNGMITTFRDANGDEVLSLHPRGWGNSHRWLYLAGSTSNSLMNPVVPSGGYRLFENSAPVDVEFIFNFDNGTFSLFFDGVVIFEDEEIFNGLTSMDAELGNELVRSTNLAYVEFARGNDSSTWIINNFRVEALEQVHVVSIETVGGGRAIPRLDFMVREGTDIPLFFMPDAGYMVSEVRVNGELVAGDVEKLILTDILEDVNVEVVFVQPATPVFSWDIFNNGLGGAPSRPNLGLAANGTIRMWAQLDGINSPVYLAVADTIVALDQNGQCAMEFVRVNKMWVAGTGWVDYFNLVDVSKDDGGWQYINLYITVYGQTVHVLLVNALFEITPAVPKIISVAPNPAVVEQGGVVEIVVTTQGMPDGAWVDLNVAWRPGLSIVGGPRFYIVDNQAIITVVAAENARLGRDGFAVAARTQGDWGSVVIVDSYAFVIEVI